MSNKRLAREGRASPRIAALTVAAVGAWPLGAVPPAVAASGDPILDVEAETGSVSAGDTVVLTATIYDTDGTTVLTGPGIEHPGPVLLPRPAARTSPAAAGPTSAATPGRRAPAP